MDHETLELIDRALAEDVGDGDATTEATVDAAARARATITQKAPGVISGLEVAEAVFRRLDPDCRDRAARARRASGATRARGCCASTGSARALLTAERTALNFLGRLSGIATATARVVRAVEEAGGGAKILDTRKTTPGLRRLEKRAVADGGGVNHRAGLYDAILIKENHSAAAGGVGEAVRRARAAAAGPAAGGRGARRRRDRRGARGRRAAAAAGQHDAGRDPRRGAAGRRPRRARGVRRVSTRRQFWSMRPLKGYTTSRWARSPIQRPGSTSPWPWRPSPRNDAPLARQHPRPAGRGARARRRSAAP